MSDKYKLGNRKTKTPAALFVDWLSFHVNTTFFFGKEDLDTFPIYYDKDKFSFTCVKEVYSTPLFNSVYTVYFEGDPFFKVCTHPKVPSINKPHLVQVKLENHVLYGADMWRVTNQFINDLRGEVHNISRLDLAVDCADQKPLEICNEWVKGNIKLKNGALMKVEPILKANHKVCTMYLGARTSDKCTTVYDKTDELQKSNKQYIEKLWKLNGIRAGDEKVCRIEVRLKSEEIKRYSIEWEDLQDRTFLARLFRTVAKSQTGFYKPTQTSGGRQLRTNECERIEVLPTQICLFSPLEKTKKQASKIIWRKKIHVKSTIEEWFQSSYDMSVFGMAWEIVEIYALEEWFWKKMEVWLKLFYDRYANLPPPPELSILKQYIDNKTQIWINNMKEEVREEVLSLLVGKGLTFEEVSLKTGVSVERVKDIYMIESLSLDI